MYVVQGVPPVFFPFFYSNQCELFTSGERVLEPVKQCESRRLWRFKKKKCYPCPCLNLYTINTMIFISKLKIK